MAGKSPQAIYKQLNNRLNQYVQLVDNQKMLEVRALKEVFGVEIEQPIKPKDNNQLNPQEPLYEILKQELEAKNQQIAELQKELSREREHSREQANQLAIFVDQAQQLQLAQMQTKLIESGSTCEAGSEPPVKPRWKFWSK